MENINKPLHLQMFETVRQGNNLLSFSELIQQFKYLSVVYHKNFCQAAMKSLYFTELYGEYTKKHRAVNKKILRETPYLLSALCVTYCIIKRVVCSDNRI